MDLKDVQERFIYNETNWKNAANDRIMIAVDCAPVRSLNGEVYSAFSLQSVDRTQP